MRVANVIEEGRWGGPQKRITLVGAAIKAHGVETVVVLPEQDSQRFRQELQQAGVAWHAMPLHRLSRGRKNLTAYLLTFFSEVMALRRLLLDGRFDAVHVSGGAWQVKAVIAGRLAGVPVIWHLNDTQLPRPLVLLFRAMGRLASGFIVAADRVKHFYLDGSSLLHAPTHLVPAPVRTDVYEPGKVEPDEKIAALPALRIVTVANINPVKGLETLIASAERVKAKLGAVSFVVVGQLHPNQQEYYDRLTARIRQAGLDGHVHFVGAYENTSTALRAADIFVCSSVAEASPMAVWEAMAMACPVVSTDVGDVAKYVTNGKNGFTVPVGDFEAMADAICRLAGDPVLRQQFGQSAREVVCRELDLASVAQRTVECYRAMQDSGVK